MDLVELYRILDCGLAEHRESSIPRSNIEIPLTRHTQNTWMISSSMIIAGLSWWQAWICVWVGYFFAAGFVCLTGRIGAVYHTSFPVTVRASFGIWGSFWPVINRVVMAIIWYGVQGYIGGMQFLSPISPTLSNNLSRRMCDCDDYSYLA